MISECFIIVPDINTKNSEISILIESIKTKFNVTKVSVVVEKTSDITIKELIDNNFVPSNNPDIIKNNLNMLIKSVTNNNYISFKEIKQYVEHNKLWKFITKNNLDNVLIIDTTTNIHHELNSNVELNTVFNKLQESNELYGYVGLCEETVNNTFNYKCNDIFFYTNPACKNTSSAYIIKKKMCDIFLKYTCPMKTDINTFIGDISRVYKKGYSLKVPLFTMSNKYINIIENRIPSQPTKDITIHTVCIIVDETKDETFVKNIKLLKQNWNNYSEQFKIVSSEAEAITFTSNLDINKNKNKNPSVLIIDSSVVPKKEDIENMTKNVPETAHFIGLNTKIIKNPFEFSNHLQYVHPDMPNFKVYLLTSNGAQMINKTNLMNTTNKNLLLCRSGFSFAYSVSDY